MKFNPLALLLDASLEGEFDLVQRIIYEVCHDRVSILLIYLQLHAFGDTHSSFDLGLSFFKFFLFQVENPSTANDEGITPLHNAVCAGHHHIVKFLLDFGVNVNAADSDGW